MCNVNHELSQLHPGPRHRLRHAQSKLVFVDLTLGLLVLGGACTRHNRFIRQVCDKLSEQERAFREELQKGASAREGFRKVQG